MMRLIAPCCVFLFAAGCTEPPATPSTSGGPDPEPHIVSKTLTFTLSETQPPQRIVLPGEGANVAAFTIVNPWQNEEVLCVPDVTIRHMSTHIDDTAEIAITPGLLTQAGMEFAFAPFNEGEMVVHLTSEVPCIKAGETREIFVRTRSAPFKAKGSPTTDARSGDDIAIELVDATVISLANSETVIGRSIFVQDGIEVDALPSVTQKLRASQFSIKPNMADSTVQPDGSFEAMSWTQVVSQHGTAIGLDGWGFTFPTATLETPLALLRDGSEVPATITTSEVGGGTSVIRIAFDEIVMDPMSVSAFSFRWMAQPGATAASVPIAFDYQKVDATSTLNCDASNEMLTGVQRSAAVWSDLTADPHSDCSTGTPSADFIGDWAIRGIVPGTSAH
ncbi:MAG: hypothetical protein ABIO72_03815 [Patescibacteria group bacterium]